MKEILVSIIMHPGNRWYLALHEDGVPVKGALVAWRNGKWGVWDDNDDRLIESVHFETALLEAYNTLATITQ